MMKIMTEAAHGSRSTGYRFIGLAIAAIAFMSVYSVGHNLYERSVDIYSAPASVAWVERDRKLIVSATAKKMAQCDVVSGGDIFLVAMLRQGSGMEPKYYPPRKPGDTRDLSGKPLLMSGDEFIVGPWLITGSNSTLEKIEEITVVLECSFASGVRRNARIGPIRRPRD